MSRRESAEARAVRRVASRAARRLDVAEWVLLLAAALFAVVGGALVAGLLSGPLGVPFRLAWLVAAAVMFGVPGLLALRKMRREDREWRERSRPENDETHV
ncbi:MAG: hypothetical protein AMXMBFR53_29560 [Gemmatimonadota bacterium]